MDLPEAIRVGSKMGPQHRNGFTNVMGTAFCVLGAAVFAVKRMRDVPTPGEFLSVLQDTWPGVATKSWSNGNIAFTTLGLEITRRNDIDGHTCEQIADWLEDVLRARDTQIPASFSLPVARVSLLGLLRLSWYSSER